MRPQEFVSKIVYTWETVLDKLFRYKTKVPFEDKCDEHKLHELKNAIHHYNEYIKIWKNNSNQFTNLNRINIWDIEKPSTIKSKVMKNRDEVGILLQIN